MISNIIRDGSGNLYEVVEGTLPDQYNLNVYTAQLKNEKEAYQAEHGVRADEAWDAVLAAAGVEYVFISPLGLEFDGVAKVYFWDARTGVLSHALERPSTQFFTRLIETLEPSDTNRAKLQVQLDALNRMGVTHAKIRDIEAEVKRGP